MIRKIAIGLAAAVIATGGATLAASAAHGSGGHGGGGGPGGGGHAGTGHGHGGGTGMAGGGHRHGGPQYGYAKHGPRPDHWRHHHHDGPRWGYREYDRYYGRGGGSCWRYYDGGREWVCPSGYRSYSREWYGPRHGYWHGGHGWRGGYGSMGKGGGGKGGGGKGGGKGHH